MSETAAMRWISVVAWMLIGLGCASSHELEARLCEGELFADCSLVGGAEVEEVGPFVVETDRDSVVVSVRVRFVSDGGMRGLVTIPVEELEPLGCDGEPANGKFRLSVPLGPLVREEGVFEPSLCSFCGGEVAVEIEVVQRGEDGERLSVYALPGAELGCAF